MLALTITNTVTLPEEYLHQDVDPNYEVTVLALKGVTAVNLRK